MPGPFPGMDPYLETPFLWSGFHGFLIAEITAALNAGLPAGLAANAEERVIIAPLERSIIPDVHVIRSGGRPDTETGQSIATLEKTVDHGIIAAYPEQERELFITIRSLENWEEVVTLIEILSPSNKREGSPGRSAYLAKQRDTLYSNTNLVEIDLLRGGLHTAAASREALEHQGDWDYLILAHRSREQWHFEYWFCHLQTPLPEVKIPLTAELADFDLDLQTALDRAYDKGPYKRRIDYNRNPPVDLDAQTLA